MKRLLDRLLTHPAVFSSLIYLALAALPRHTLPFVERDMFKFEVPTQPVAVPVSFIDGERQPIESVVGFSGFTGADVDVHYPGYQSSVEHRFHEQQQWIDAHLSGERGPGPIEVIIGIQIIDVTGESPSITFREDARGTAWPQ